MKPSPTFAVGVSSLAKLNRVAERLATEATPLSEVIRQVNDAYGVPATTTPCEGMAPCLSQILTALKSVGLVWIQKGKDTGFYAQPRMS
jgi:hypothetical protein